MAKMRQQGTLQDVSSDLGWVQGAQKAYELESNEVTNDIFQRKKPLNMSIYSILNRIAAQMFSSTPQLNCVRI